MQYFYLLHKFFRYFKNSRTEFVYFNYSPVSWCHIAVTGQIYPCYCLRKSLIIFFHLRFSDLISRKDKINFSDNINYFFDVTYGKLNGFDIFNAILRHLTHPLSVWVKKIKKILTPPI